VGHRESSKCADAPTKIIAEGCAKAGAFHKLATIAVSRPAPTPTTLRGRGVQYSPRRRDMAHEQDTEEEPSDQVDTEHGEEDDSEADAEGEVEDDSEADAEGEDDDEIVGAVKTRSLRRNSRRQADEEDEDEDAAVDVHHDSDEDSSESGAEKDWEAADEDVEDEVEIKNPRASHCT
jgi:hypothetical protein